MARFARLLVLAAALAGAAAILRLLLEWTRSQRSATDPMADAVMPEAGRPEAPATASREELYRQAAALNIRGRSKMNKRQLADAIAAAQAAHGEAGGNPGGAAA